ncbi:hypothetical protein HZZ00_11085 [Streptomyces sp. NEAU-sy36]|uniref:hypothetical protein n=1 Tax=unclassified Streptomyces TaxID=2593676 RepID=UPI0015D5A58E|nr:MULTISPECIES: hypothetical protein [unclassified Streptomyces]QLJ01515.1 hypothetical protein HZZ00_11085 [Streptomyces sp. NEAU-sy36]
MPKFTLITCARSDRETADATARARLIADWLAASGKGDVIAAARIEWEAGEYDPALADEIAALHSTPAAA